MQRRLGLAQPSRPGPRPARPWRRRPGGPGRGWAAAARGGWRPARTGRRRGWPRRPRPACQQLAAQLVEPGRQLGLLLGAQVVEVDVRRARCRSGAGAGSGAGAVATRVEGRRDRSVVAGGPTRCSPSGVQRLLTPGSVEARVNRESGVAPSGAPPPGHRATVRRVTVVRRGRTPTGSGRASDDGSGETRRPATTGVMSHRHTHDDQRAQDQRPHPRTRRAPGGPRRPTARDTPVAGSPGHRPTARPGSGRSRTAGQPTRLPHHGLRQVQVRRGAEGQGVQAQDHERRDQGDEVPAEDRSRRLRHQDPAGPQVPERGPQGQGHDHVPGSRGVPPRAGQEDPRPGGRAGRRDGAGGGGTEARRSQHGDGAGTGQAGQAVGGGPGRAARRRRPGPGRRRQPAVSRHEWRARRCIESNGGSPAEAPAAASGDERPGPDEEGT